MAKSNHELSPALIMLTSITIGLAVASDHYAQPLLDTITRSFSLSTSPANFIVTATQLGYAAGLLFLAPPGDVFEHRYLIVSIILLAAGGMLVTASSQSLAMMILGTTLTGLFSVMAQILAPLVVTLASPNKRDKVVGTIMSGLLLGTLLVRTIVGSLANLGGWHIVFWVASVLMALMALALWCGLPQMKLETHFSYSQLLGSVSSMFISGKVLRTHALLGRLTFTDFSILRTPMTFLFVASSFNYGSGVIGLSGPAGAAGALDARPVGGLAGRGRSHHTTTFGLLLLLLSWLAIWFGHTFVLALIIGILVLDFIVQGVHITSQMVTCRIHPDARNRLTTGYMTNYFTGGVAGSLISASVRQYDGWAGTCLADATIAPVNLLVWWRGFHRQEAAN